MFLPSTESTAEEHARICEIEERCKHTLAPNIYKALEYLVSDLEIEEYHIYDGNIYIIVNLSAWYNRIDRFYYYLPPIKNFSRPSALLSFLDDYYYAIKSHYRFYEQRIKSDTPLKVKYEEQILHAIDKCRSAYNEYKGTGDNSAYFDELYERQEQHIKDIKKADTDLKLANINNVKPEEKTPPADENENVAIEELKNILMGRQ